MATQPRPVTPASEGRQRDGARIRLLDIEPDLLQYLSSDDRDRLESITLAVVPLPEGQSLALTEFLAEYRSFSAILQTGMVLHDLQLGAQPGIRLLGPGEVVSLREAPASPMLVTSSYRAIPDTTLVLLRSDFLLAARQAPGLIVGLQSRLAEQIERLATQLVICQLPRVEDRLLAMLWLLAESWGRVTPSGTTLPLSLTHELLGAMIGARRPTVTLALGELAGRGALVHQDRGWLLLDRPKHPSGAPTVLDPPGQLEYVTSDWAEPAVSSDDAGLRLDVLRDTIRGLREEHARNVRRVDDRLRQSALSQQRSRELRERIRRRQAITRQPPPSS
jgi:CRP/FNR family cyclic AMP-dependent transcriptional regulator